MKNEVKGVTATGDEARPALPMAEALLAASVKSPDQLKPNPSMPAHLNASQGHLTLRRRGAENYDTLLWRLIGKRDEQQQGGFVVAVTGCDAKSGVSTVAANLAIRAADNQLGQVVLVDANAKRPKVDRLFRLRNAQGLADVMSGSCELGDALHSTNVEGLDTMPIGTPGLFERTSWDPGRFEALLSELADEYSLVVFDLPEATQLQHGLLIARQADAAVLVVRSQAVKRKEGRLLVERLTSDGVNLVGAVLTRQKQYIPRWFRRWA